MAHCYLGAIDAILPELTGSPAVHSPELHNNFEWITFSGEETAGMQCLVWTSLSEYSPDAQIEGVLYRL